MEAFEKKMKGKTQYKRGLVRYPLIRESLTILAKKNGMDMRHECDMDMDSQHVKNLKSRC